MRDDDDSGRPFRFWQLRVFVGSGAMGNVTGVVAVAPGTPTGEMARRAALLGYPDTAFVRGTPAGPQVLSFSPYEEMRLCTQTLLATEHVLRATGGLAAGEPMRALTRAGVVPVTRDGDDRVAYVDLPAERTTVRRAATPLPVGGGAGGAVVVDTGRARAYLSGDLDEVDAAVLAPAAVREFCRAEDVSGICLVAETADPRVLRMRVFTMSLDGAEDVATGGAAGGLCALRRAEGRPLAAETRVDQGAGGPQGRAELWVRPTGGDGARVGGRVEMVAAGRLHAQLPRRIAGRPG